MSIKLSSFLLNALKILILVSLLRIIRASASPITNFDLSSTILDTQLTGFTIAGDLPGSNFGYSYQTAGDINNDGYDDIIIGGPYVSGGRAYVIYGGPTSSFLNLDLSSKPLDPLTTGFIIQPNTTADYVGYFVSRAGDIDKDGYDDIIVAAPYALDQYRGMVYVIYGGEKSSLPNLNLKSDILNPATTGFTVRGNYKTDRFGNSIGAAGDINNDGYDDIILATPDGNYSKGLMHVMYGGPRSSFSNLDFSTQTLDPATTGFTISGSAYNDYIGYSVNTAGDVNKDGYDDFIITTYYKTVIYVIYGGEKSTFRHVTLNPVIPTLPFPGFMVFGTAGPARPAGDVNGDGYDDLIVGFEKANNSNGAAYVIYGGPTASLLNINLTTTALDPATTGFTISGNTADSFGSSVSKAGDINKDGYDDIIVRASARATSYVIYGGPKSSLKNIDLSSTTLDPAKTGFTIRNVGSGSTAGDFNNDGYDDLLFVDTAKGGAKGVAYIIHSVCSHAGNCPPPVSICPSCKSKAGSSNPNCARCPSNCIQYENDVSCQICKDGYFLSKSPIGFSCSECFAHCVSCKSATSCQACAKGYILQSSFCISPSSISSTPSGATPPSSSETSSSALASKKEKAKALQAISSTVTGAGSTLCVGNTRFPLSALVSKIVQNTRYINLTVTDDLAEIYKTWDTNLISWEVPNALSQSGDYKTSPFLFAQYGIGSPFLANFWPTFVTIIIGGGILAICFVLKKSFERTKYEGRLSNLVRKLFVGSFNFVIVQTYGCLDDVLFNAVLDMKTNPYNTFYSWVSLVIAVVFMALGGLLIFFNLWTVKKYQRIKNDKRALEVFNERNKYWELFYSEFNDEDFWSQFALALFVMRSIATSFIIIVLYEYPLMQTAYLLMLDGVIILFLFFKKPFPTLRGKLAQYYFETITLLVHICAFSLAIQDSMENHSDDLKEFLCRAIIYLNSSLVTGGIAFMSIEIYKIISQRKKAGKQKKFGSIETQTISEEQRNPVSPMTRGTEQIYDSPYRRQTVNTEQGPSFENFHLLSGFTHENSHISFSGMNLEPSNRFNGSMDAANNDSILQQQGFEMNDSIMRNSPNLRPKIRRIRIHQQ